MTSNSLIVVMTATALLSAPMGALAADDSATLPPCVEVSTDPPDVTIDPSCLPDPDVLPLRPLHS